MLPCALDWQVGRRKVSGDFLLYDGLGRLCLRMARAFYIFAAVQDTYKHVGLHWQPLALCPAGSAPLKAALCTHQPTSWTPEQHEAASAHVRARLKQLGVDVDRAMAGSTEQPGSGEAPVPPPVPGLEGRMEGLLATVADRLGGGEGSGDRLSDGELNDVLQWSTGHADEVKAVAEGLLALAAAEQERQGGGPLVVRVMEVAESEGCPTVAEPLSRLSLPAGVKFECCVASHSSGVLPTLARRVQRRSTTCVLRRLLLPSEGLPGSATEVGDCTFHALVVHEHSASATQQQEGKAAALLRIMRPFLMPGAPVVVCGFTPVPQWAQVLSLASSRPLSSLADANDAAASHEGSITEWQHELVSGGEPHLIRPLHVLLGAVPLELARRGGRFLIAANTAEQVEQIKAALAQGGESADEPATAEALMIGDSVTAEAIAESLKAALATSAVDAVVFAAGLDDTSAIGEDGYSRLLRLSQALMLTEEVFIEHTNRRVEADACAERPTLWVLTEGLYNGSQLRPNQGTLAGLTKALLSEIRALAPRHIDLAATGEDGRAQSLRTAAGIILGRCRESQLAVLAGGEVMVPRYHQVSDIIQPTGRIRETGASEGGREGRGGPTCPMLPRHGHTHSPRLSFAC